MTTQETVYERIRREAREREQAERKRQEQLERFKNRETKTSDEWNR